MAATTEELKLGNPAYQAFLLLRVGFTAAPILFGLDKFFNWTVDWTNYLAPWVTTSRPQRPGLHVRRRRGGDRGRTSRRRSASARTWSPRGSAASSSTSSPSIPPRYYDIALRDFGLMLSADARPAEHRVQDGAGGFAGRALTRPRDDRVRRERTVTCTALG